MKIAPFFSALFLTACVTINIYFPAAAAEQVADEIIKGIQTEQQDPVDSNQLAPQSLLDRQQPVFYRWINGALDLMVSPAYAEADLSADTPEIRQIRATMQNRYAQLKGFYANGLVGIQADGLLVVRGSVPLKDRNKVNKLVTSENADRNRLYQAIANANGHPEWFKQIKSTFASSWVSNARPGWWYQTSSGSWKQK